MNEQDANGEESTVISIEYRNGKKRILASPNKIVRPTQILIHVILSATGVIGLATANVLLAVPMILLLSPVNVFVICDEFYKSTTRSSKGFDLGGERNAYHGYVDLLFEIFHPSLRYNIYNGPEIDI